jgi:glycine/D-amino acid oxidase-like deaminating enzyme
MTMPNDTREQARAVADRDLGTALQLAKQANCGGCTPFYLCDDHRAVAAALSRARREGMEEAAGIVEDMAAPSQMILRTATAGRVAAAILRAAKEDDHG